MKVVPGAPHIEPPYCNKAGQDEIARLRADNERLRAALAPFAAEPLSTEPEHNRTRLFSWDDLDAKIRCAREAMQS